MYFRKEIIFLSKSLTGYSPGRVSRHLTVDTNDPLHRHIVLSFKGKLERAIVWTPLRLDFGAVYFRDLPAERTLRIYAPSGVADFSIESAKISGAPFLSAKVDRAAPEIARLLLYYEATVTLEANSSPGSIEAKLLVKTNYPNKPSIEIPIAGEVYGDWRAEPSILAFGLLKAGTSVQRTVRVFPARKAEVGKDKPFRVEIDGECFSARLEPSLKDQLYNVVVTAEPHQNQVGKQEGRLLIYFSENPQKPLTVRLYALVTPSSEPSRGTE